MLDQKICEVCAKKIMNGEQFVELPIKILKMNIGDQKSNVNFHRNGNIHLSCLKARN